MNYQKGDIILIPFPFTNQRGAKRRPALIISDQTVHQTGDVLVVQITSQFYSDALTEQIHTNDLTYPLPKQSYIRCHKIFVVEQTLIIGKISALNPSKYQQVIDKILAIIG
jgi:mRNA interferase MazF